MIKHFFKKEGGLVKMSHTTVILVYRIHAQKFSLTQAHPILAYGSAYVLLSSNAELGFNTVNTGPVFASLRKNLISIAPT